MHVIVTQKYRMIKIMKPAEGRVVIISARLLANGLIFPRSDKNALHKLGTLKQCWYEYLLESSRLNQDPYLAPEGFSCVAEK